jgi:hypothetical protein
MIGMRHTKEMGNLTEARLQSECYMFFHNNYPHLRGLYFEIFNNSFSACSGAKHKAMGRIPGVGDSCLLLPNGCMPVFFEFKTDAGKQSEVQINWQILITSHGYKYFVIKSVDQFKSQLYLLL